MTEELTLTEFRPQQTNLINLDSPTTIQTIKSTICKGASNEQLFTFLSLAKHFNLNPFNKEIYFNSQIGIFVGIHGKKRIANRHPDFRGLNSQPIREKDEFEFDAANNKIVKHITGKDKGRTIGAWAVAKRKGFDDVYEICWLDEFKKENPAWKGYSQDMIQYKAQARVLSVQFNSEFEGINTIEADEEFIIETRPTFAESHSPAVGVLTDADYLEDDKKTDNNHITDLQRKRIFAIAKSDKELVKQIVKKYGYERTSDVLMSDYEAICKDLEDPYAEYAEMQTGVAPLPYTLDEAVKQKTLGIDIVNPDYL